MEKVVVAMSGGVDSSVSALLLKEAGYDLVGISLQVWDYRNRGGNSARKSCCAPADFLDARMVASRLGIPYYVFDLESVFKEKVIDKFVTSYQSGETPNPCIDCNNQVKFGELRRRAQAIGYTSIATGHYARIESGPDGPRLLRGRDLAKDQSYFLYGTRPQELAKTFFPVGNFTKEEVRALARAAGLVNADKSESQDICFVSGSVKEFVDSHGSCQTNLSGTIEDSSGTVIGAHDGIHQFTIGQRKGLPSGSKSALYVLQIDANEKRVVVGERHELERESFAVEEITMIKNACDLEGGNSKMTALAQLRYRAQPVAVEVQFFPGGRAAVRFTEKSATVTPGQACVFYSLDNEEVLGGGKIMKQQLQEAA